MTQNEMVRYVVLLLFCIYISKEDIHTRCIKNKTLLVAIGVAAPLVLASMDRNTYISCLIGMALGFLISFLTSWLSREGIGMGDVKLIATAGLYLGAAKLGIAVFWGLVLILLFGLIQLLRRKVTRKTEYPFAPFFAGGIMIAFCLQLRGF